jgi:V/A-type H+-transporting ATPase subunit C
LPERFGEATAEAVRALSATANPQTVDLILDAACFEAMLDLARHSGVKFAETLVVQRIDLTNLVTCLRRMRSSDRYVGEVLPREFFLEGGSLSYDFLRGLCQAGEEEFWTRIGYSAYERVVLRDARSASIGAVERACDHFFMHTVRSARMIPFGAEPIVAYLIATEFEVKNLRILLSGHEISLSQKEIRERMRLSYV